MLLLFVSAPFIACFVPEILYSIMRKSALSYNRENKERQKMEGKE